MPAQKSFAWAHLITLWSAAGIEVIEVNGAVFYRKRKPSQAPLPGTPAAKLQIDDIKQPATIESAIALPSETHSLPSATPALPSLVDPLVMLQHQLESCLPLSCPKAIAVQFALEQLLMQGASRLDRSIEGGTSGPSQLYTQAAKRVLQGFAQLMQGRVDAASALLLQVKPPTAALAAPIITEVSSEAPCAVVESEVNPPDQSLAEFLALPPLIRDQCQSGCMLRSHLQRQLSALQQEEEAWINIRSKGEQQDGETTAAAPVSDSTNGDFVTDSSKAVPLDAAGAGDPAFAGGVSVDPPAGARLSVLKQTEDRVNSAMGMQASLYIYILLSHLLSLGLSSFH